MQRTDFTDAVGHAGRRGLGFTELRRDASTVRDGGGRSKPRVETLPGFSHTSFRCAQPPPPRPTTCPERAPAQDSSHSSRGARPVEAPRRRVLIFDDSELCLVFGREVLIREGFDVGVAQRLAEFDRILQDWRPDVILADVRMPEVDGATLCRRLKQNLRTAHVLVVLFSNLSSSHLAALATGCGADAYVSKTDGFELLPVTISSLCEEILW